MSIQSTVPGLPTAFQYKANCYYVRDCYITYYELVMNRLEEFDYISVIGTPGIGKSIFYHYFFSRYRSEHPQVPIVTASFNEDRQLKKCVLFTISGFEYIRKEEFENLPVSYPTAIHLYDGPPNMEPSGSKMIAFTSPNVHWLESMRKELAGHCLLYMPVWEYKELVEAVELLALDIPVATVEKQYQEFGGVARYCFLKNAETYQVALNTLEEAIEKIESFEDVQSCFKKKMPMDLVVHRLLHYVPDENPRFATLKFGSNQIGLKIFNNLKVKLFQERAKLMLWLESAGKASTLHGWMFENLAHEILIKGGDFKCTILEKCGNNEQESIISINPTHEFYERVSTNFTLEMVFQNIYQIPKSQYFKSIDSFCFNGKDHIIMFQITKSVSHPVNPTGLIEVFSRLNCLESIKQTPTRAHLVFVVPKGVGKNFKRQNLLQSTANFNNWMECPVTIIPGIGDGRQKTLNGKGIYTCFQLLLSHQDKSISHEVKCLDKFRQQADKIKEISFLDEIPQFLLEIDTICISKLFDVFS